MSTEESRTQREKWKKEKKQIRRLKANVNNCSKALNTIIRSTANAYTFVDENDKENLQDALDSIERNIAEVENQCVPQEKPLIGLKESIKSAKEALRVLEDVEVIKPSLSIFLTQLRSMIVKECEIFPRE